ncbi:MAG: hypothetical protein R6U61_05760 [Thermoplasmata archaeon]
MLNMELDEFNKSARILGRKHVPPLLSEVKKKGWSKASDLASYVGVTVATTVSYLEDLEDIGVLEKRRAKGLTGEIWQYRLRSDHIELETDVDRTKYQDTV